MSLCLVVGLTGFSAAPLTADWLRIGLEGGPASWRRIRSSLPLELTVDAQGIVYAVFEDGHLYRSQNGGAAWTRVGTDLRSRIADLEPTPAGLLSATEAGLFRSTDRAATWRSLNRGLTELEQGRRGRFVPGLIRTRGRNAILTSPRT